MKFKKTALLILSFVICISLFSCIDGSQARETIDNFITLVAIDDYEGAEEWLHPTVSVSLSEYLARVEKEEEIDFSKGVEIIRYTSVHSAHYHTSVKGSLYETTVKIKVGDEVGEMEVTVVDNDAGYGIYSLEFDF